MEDIEKFFLESENGYVISPKQQEEIERVHKGSCSAPAHSYISVLKSLIVVKHRNSHVSRQLPSGFKPLEKRRTKEKEKGRARINERQEKKVRKQQDEGLWLVANLCSFKFPLLCSPILSSCLEQTQKLLF